MATQFCQKCKQAHPGRVCDYDEKGECAETIGVNEVAQTGNEPQKTRKMEVRYDPEQVSAPCDKGVRKITPSSSVPKDCIFQLERSVLQTKPASRFPLDFGVFQAENSPDIASGACVPSYLSS